MYRIVLSLALLVGAMAILSSSPSNAQESEPLQYGIQIEEFEFRRGDEKENIAAWNGDAFIGTDEIKIRLSNEVEYDIRESKFGKLETRLVAQTPISTFFDIKAGARLDTPDGPDRWYGVLGVIGLAPQWFEIDADLFVSENGDASARLDVEYELLITNWLILTPSADIDFAFSDDTTVEIKSGFTSVEVGLRLSYDVVDRLISPYVGLVYERKLGNTADLIEISGEDIDSWSGAVGVKFVF